MLDFHDWHHPSPSASHIWQVDKENDNKHNRNEEEEVANEEGGIGCWRDLQQI